MSVAWRGQSNPSCECTSCLLRCAFGFSLFAILCVPPDTTAHTPSDPFAQVIYHTSNWLWLLLYRYECTDVSARASFALQDQNVVPPNGSRHPPGLYAGVLAHGSFRPLGWLQHLVQPVRGASTFARGNWRRAPSCSLHLCLATTYNEGDLCRTRHHARRKHRPPCVLLCALVRTSGNRL